MVNIINNNKYVDNCRLTIQLKYILENLFKLEDFALWYSSTVDILLKYNISMATYIKRIKFFGENTKLATTFFQYCKKLISFETKLNVRESIDFLFKSNVLGPIIFVTPELGRWSTIGGLGVMVINLINF